MAFKLVSCGGANVEPTIIEMEATATTPIAIGDILIRAEGETKMGRLAHMNTNVGCYRIIGVACNAIASGTGLVKFIPVNEAQIWEADTTAATSVSYIGYNAGITGAYVDGAANASGTTGCFFIIGNVGATSNNKVLGKFNRVPIAHL